MTTVCAMTCAVNAFARNDAAIGTREPSVRIDVARTEVVESVVDRIVAVVVPPVADFRLRNDSREREASELTTRTAHAPAGFADVAHSAAVATNARVGEARVAARCLAKVDQVCSARVW